MYVSFPRVTQVINEMLPSEGLEIWRAKVGEEEAERIARESSTLGTIIHYRVLKKLVKYEIPPPRFEIKNCPKDVKTLCEIAEHQWNELTKRDLKIDPSGLEVEKFVVNDELKVCGTYDLAGKVSVFGKAPKLTVIDLKTSPVARESHFIQLGAYALFMDPYPDQGIIISLCPHIEKNPTLEAKMYIVPKKELKIRSEQFKELLDRFHKKHPSLKKFEYVK